jgi:hypothetical protein
MCTIQRWTSYFLSSLGILPTVSVCTSWNRSTALLRKGLYVLLVTSLFIDAVA